MIEVRELPLEALFTMLAGPPPSIFDDVLSQMRHLSYDGNCGCKRTAASEVMTRNHHIDDEDWVPVMPRRRRRAV